MQDFLSSDTLPRIGSADPLDEYSFYDIPVHCPYGLPKMAVYHQNRFATVDNESMATFFDRGFRRNGNIMYSMACPDCRACIPIRLKPGDFRPNRNQKRVWKRNRDVSVEMVPLRITGEKLSLLEKFLRLRYSSRENSALGYYSDFFINSLTNTREILYRIQNRLIGVALVDVGKDFLNGVYFYFDPDDHKRSPGTFNILYLLDFCQQHHIEHFYLGFLIKEIKAMSYKQNFRPHYLRINNIWQRFDRGEKKPV